jgi:glycosyltransferase involved in cell wall biosynthesis
MDSWVALLGRRDHPTDAVEDYCTYLGQALAERGVQLQLARVPWAEVGWARALGWLWRESEGWRGKWVLVQYTALQWSRRGFPVGLLAVIRVLKVRGCLVVVVYHDPLGFPGMRLVDRVRRATQHLVMRLACQRGDRAIFTLPLDAVSWLRGVPAEAAVIPVGSNLPDPVRNDRCTMPAQKTVAVFGVTGGTSCGGEVGNIASAIRCAADQLRSLGTNLRLVVLGRGSREAEGALRSSLAGSGVRLSVLGVLPTEEVSHTLAGADVLLFVRGPVSGRRGSAIAGIACGLPVVGYQGSETGFPITEAGVWLVPLGDREKLGRALAEVLMDEPLWQTLHRRSIEAYRRYFSWEAIASRLIEVLGDG